MSLAQRFPFEVLEPERIRKLLSPLSMDRLFRLTVLDETDSSNSALQRLPLEQQHAHVILAESQTRGKGRRQRSWYSPPGCNVYLSLGWRFADSELPLSTLPLVAAICTCRALARTGLQGHGIKWPNDILVNGAKLAGILVELQTTAGGPAHAVIGVGVNVSMPKSSAAGQQADAAIDRKWTDLASHLPCAASSFSRNSVAALLLDELLAGVLEYEAAGFSAFSTEWMALDLLAGQQVRVQHQETSSAGIARGISEDGGLLLEVIKADGRVEKRIIVAGEVSVHHG